MFLINRYIIFINKHVTNKFFMTLFVIFSLSSLIYPNSNENSITDENTLIAAYIERFTRFIDWPQSHLIENKSIIKIGISGNYNLYLKMVEFSSSIKIKNKVVEVKLIKTLDDINDIDIIFIGSKDLQKLSRILKICEENSILTISYSQGFAEKGIIINLYKENNVFKFEINEQKAREFGFKISHLLLSKSKIVR